MPKKILSFLVLFLWTLNQVYAYSWDLVESSFITSNIEEEVIIQEDDWIEEITSPQSSPQGEEVEQVETWTEELEINSWSTEYETWTGDIDSVSWSGEIEDSNPWIIDEYSDRFKIIFQNPTYLLDKDMEKETYICDDSQDECKINFNIDDLELTTFSSKFYCRVDFGFITWEEEKCNPNTVVFWTWTSLVLFQIFQNEDDSLIWEKSLEIVNSSLEPSPIEGEEMEQWSWSIETWTWDIETSSWNLNTWSWEIFTNTWYTQTGSLETNSWTLDTWTWEVLSWVILEIPEPFIEVQSWLNYLTWNIWQCSKESCKINLTWESSFTWWFTQSDYQCLWSFSWWSFSTAWTEEKCNPWYVDYWTWEYEISFKIYEKWNLDNFKESFIEIYNIIESEEEEEVSLEPSPLLEEELVKSWDGWTGGWTSYIQEKDIVVQSGLEYKNWNYQCMEERCKVNLEYKDSSKETCLWDFWAWENKEKYKTTCNPGFVYFTSGEHKISLQIFSEWILSSTRSLRFKNTYLDELRQNNNKPVAKITLQWRLAKYKQLTWNKLVCRDVEECSVNSTWDETLDENFKDLIFFWDFGNGEIFTWVNPLLIKYKPGKYTISLTVTDIFWEQDKAYFYVEVLWDIVEDLIIDENIFSNLKISWVMPNNSWVDDYEWIELENTWDTILNLKWVSIDDIIWKGSKPYIIDYDLFLNPQKKKRFYKSKTKLSLWNTIDEVNILYNKIIVDNLSWDFKVPDDFIITHENVWRPLQKVFVKRVVDGDTIDVIFENWKLERVRLIWVDTPETKHPKKPVEEFWIEAYNFTKDTLEWKYVLLETWVDDRGKYGRLLAYIRTSPQPSPYKGEGVATDELISFNEMLIEKWYARAYLKYPFKYSKLYEALEKKAKKDKVWLWWNKEVMEVIKEWIEEDDEYLEELEKEELYDFREIFLNWLNLDELKRKSVLIQKDLGAKINNKKKNLTLKNDWFSVSKTKAKNIDEVVELEKELKSSISYRVSKQKKWLKITWNSKQYKSVVMLFDGERIILQTDENWDFNYYTTSINPWDFILEFYWADESVWDIFLKNSRTVSLESKYVENMKTYKIKSSTKTSSVKKDKPIKLSVVPEFKKEVSSSNQSIPIILNLLLGFLVMLFMFLVLRKRNII